jgi:hypothetical protein
MNDFTGTSCAIVGCFGSSELRASAVVRVIQLELDQESPSSGNTDGRISTFGSFLLGRSSKQSGRS